MGGGGWGCLKMMKFKVWGSGFVRVQGLGLKAW